MNDFYDSLLHFMSRRRDDLIRCYSPSENSTSYCAPVISNGSIYTQVDISGIQKQDVHYIYHGPKGSKQDMVPGVYIAGRRYDTMQRQLIPFGYFEEETTVDGERMKDAVKAGQILDLGSGSIGCRNDYPQTISVYTHAFVHRELPLLAVRKKFVSSAAQAGYRFDYYYAGEGPKRTPVKWSDFTITALPDNAGAVIRYQVDGTKTLRGAVTLLCSVPPDRIETDGCRTSFVFGKVPEQIGFFILYTDSFGGKDWEEEQRKAVEKIRKEKFDGLFARHASLWDRLWKNFALRIPDKRMESVFHTAVYTLICSSTPWGVPVGVHPYCWNGNYFGFNLFAALFCMLGNREAAARIPTFRRKALKNAIARTTNWAYSAGARFPWQSDEEGFYECACPGVWVDHIFHMGNIALESWDYFRYTKDEEFLRETAYPVIEKCAEFFMCQAVYELGDGRVIIGKCCDLERLGTARENAFLTTCSAICTLETAATAAELLGEDREKAQGWLKTAAALRRSLPSDGGKYLPFPGCGEKSIGVFGGSYPYPVLPPSDPLQRAAVRDYLDNASTTGNMYPVGKNICPWYAAWAANALLRMGEAPEAADYLRKAAASAGAFDLLYEINEPGIFVSHPWCTEPPSNYVQGVMELLCRSEKETLLICSGLENTWKDLSFTIHAPDDLSVSAEMKNGKIVFLKISAGTCYSGETTRVRLPGQVVDLNMKANETRILIGKENSKR